MVVVVMMLVIVVVGGGCVSELGHAHGCAPHHRCKDSISAPGCGAIARQLLARWRNGARGAVGPVARVGAQLTSYTSRCGPVKRPLTGQVRVTSLA